MKVTLPPMATRTRAPRGIDQDAGAAPEHDVGEHGQDHRPDLVAERRQSGQAAVLVQAGEVQQKYSTA